MTAKADPQPCRGVGYEFSSEEEVALPAGQLFSVVLDVEKYPEFLPWCKVACVYDCKPGAFVASLLVGSVGVEGEYVSRVLYSSPVGMCVGWIRAESVKGVVSFLRSEWHFTPISENKTLIRFSLRFSFKNRLLHFAFCRVAGVVEKRLVAAFKKRAYQLFG